VIIIPTYTYKCSKCEDITEVIQKITEDKLTKCEVCNVDTLESIIKPSGGFRIAHRGITNAASKLG